MNEDTECPQNLPGLFGVDPAALMTFSAWSGSKSITIGGRKGATILMMSPCCSHRYWNILRLSVMSAPTSGALNPNIFPEKCNGRANLNAHNLFYDLPIWKCYLPTNGYAFGPGTSLNGFKAGFVWGVAL